MKAVLLGSMPYCSRFAFVLAYATASLTASSSIVVPGTYGTSLAPG